MENLNVQEIKKIIQQYCNDKTWYYPLLAAQEIFDRFGSNAWQPFEGIPKDGSPIVRWHIIHKCEVTVRYKPGMSENGDCVWVDGTYSNTWSEEAFEPLWKLPQPPDKLTEHIFGDFLYGETYWCSNCGAVYDVDEHKEGCPLKESAWEQLFGDDKW